ncbi:alpha/beta hydrolase [Paenibacillus koleovorans]|uniref:alpha/beta hydrolase n=1 Tax=Paenibacillus koleovorans TaxID=121608 RepID=UPI001FEAEC13|nr:alpha/beta hydrolase [Paenibacillus koleovorans]
MKHMQNAIHPPLDESGIILREKLNLRWMRYMLFPAVILIAAILTFHGYIAWALARPTIAPLTSNPLEAVGLAYEDVHFPSSDGTGRLEGWYIPSEGSHRSVVFSHGYGGNREELWVPFYSLAEELHKRSYNVLLFDYSYVRPEISATGGIRESRELQGAIEYVRTRGGTSNYVWGFSMGAGTALQTALYSQDITGMVLDSTFILEPDTMFMNVRQQINLPNISNPLIRLFFPFLNGTSIRKIPYEAVKSTSYSVPILFIHGMKDAKAPYDMVESIYANQSENPNSNLWLVPNGRHELIYKANKREYLKRSFEFLKRAE